MFSNLGDVDPVSPSRVSLIIDMKCVNETLPVASFSIYSVCHVFGEFNREIGGNLQNILIHLKPESNMNPVPKKSFFNIQYPWCILPPNTEVQFTCFSVASLFTVSSATFQVHFTKISFIIALFSFTMYPTAVPTTSGILSVSRKFDDSNDLVLN